jgi:glycosyltransferase EpsE
MENEKNAPLVSIIMGAYNCADFVSKAIDSILAQTYENWEFIICNDCSKDKTIDVLQAYAAKDPRIKVIANEKNMGLAATLNHCLSVANGVYVARMDADDESMPNRLEKEASFLEAHPEYAVVGSARIIFDETGDCGVRQCSGEAKKETLLTNPPFAHPTIMMRKSAYDQLEGYTVDASTMRAEDLDLWFRFFHAGLRGYNLEEPLYRYHESRSDYKKRSLRAGIQTAKVYLRGYQLIGFPKIKRIFALKPIISSIVPDAIMYQFHSRRIRTKGD